MVAQKKRRHGLLPQEPRIKAWYGEVSLGSVGTAKNYLRIVGLFAERSSVALIAFPNLYFRFTEPERTFLIG